MNHTAPASGLHLRNQRPGERHTTRQVEFHDPVPVGIGDLINCLGNVASRVVDQDVDPAHPVQNMLSQPGALFAAGHVGGGPAYFGPGLGLDFRRRRGEFVGMTAAEKHTGASFGKSESHGFAEPFASPGDQGDAAREIEQWMHV